MPPAPAPAPGASPSSTGNNAKQTGSCFPCCSCLGGIFVLPMLILALVFGIVLGGDSSDCLGSSGGTVVCPDGTTSVFAKTASFLQKLNNNLDTYKQTAAQTNVPWEVLAAIHYREATLNSGQSALSGEAIGTYNPDNGMTSSSFLDSLIKSGNHLQGKVGNQLTQGTTDAALIKQALERYNGVASSYKSQAQKLGFSESYEGSPYVMNNFDAAHQKMGIITKNNSNVIDGTDTRDGAYTVFALLKNAQIDPSTGNILSVGNCTVLGESATATSTTPDTATTDTTSTDATASNADEPNN